MQQLLLTRRSPLQKVFGPEDHLMLFTATQSPPPLSVGGNADDASDTSNNGTSVEATQTTKNRAFGNDSPHMFIVLRWWLHQQIYQVDADDVEQIRQASSEALSVIRQIQAERTLVEAVIDFEADEPSGNRLVSSAFVDANKPLPLEMTVGYRLIRRSWRGAHDIQLTAEPNR